LIAGIVAAALLSAPLHCVAEALDARVPPAAASVRPGARPQPALDARMCCRPKDGVLPSSRGAAPAEKSAFIGAAAAPPPGASAAERRVLPRSLGPPGLNDPAVRAPARVIPLLI